MGVASNACVWRILFSVLCLDYFAGLLAVPAIQLACSLCVRKSLDTSGCRAHDHTVHRPMGCCGRFVRDSLAKSRHCTRRGFIVCLSGMFVRRCVRERARVDIDVHDFKGQPIAID